VFDNLNEIAVFFSKGTVPDKGGERQVKRIGKGTGFGCPGVGRSGAQETAVEVG
jgi:hypothetical protein